MATQTRTDLAAAARQLPREEQELLAEEILTSLDTGEISPEWLAEIERRDKRIREGTAVLKDADQVFADAYSRLDAKDRI